ncbi:hypothetical protein [Bdellovibrio bacteriovorus]|uniref:hypothetical protein n=1 Tax=Bdellovibrio bacteriovorus TaxID=959 RepID=UPI0035A67738
MKKMILLASLCASFAAHANDRYVPVVSCVGEGVSLLVVEGGLAGIPMIQLQRTEEGVTSSENHYVRRADAQGRIGAPTTWVGKKVALTVNLTTAPAKDGSRPGVLSIQEGKQTTKLSVSCSRL